MNLKHQHHSCFSLESLKQLFSCRSRKFKKIELCKTKCRKCREGFFYVGQTRFKIWILCKMESMQQPCRTRPLCLQHFEKNIYLVNRQFAGMVWQTKVVAIFWKNAMNKREKLETICFN